jgi:hypothetical protein
MPGAVFRLAGISAQTPFHPAGCTKGHEICRLKDLFTVALHPWRRGWRRSRPVHAHLETVRGDPVAGILRPASDRYRARPGQCAVRNQQRKRRRFHRVAISWTEWSDHRKPFHLRRLSRIHALRMPMARFSSLNSELCRLSERRIVRGSAARQSPRGIRPPGGNKAARRCG